MYYLANANNSLHDEQTEISMEKYQMNGSKRVITVFPLPEKKKKLLSNPIYHLNIKNFCCFDNAFALSLPVASLHKYDVKCATHGINLF